MPQNEAFESLKWEIEFPSSKRRTKVWCKEILGRIVCAYDEDAITKDEYLTLTQLFKTYPEGKAYLKI